MSYIKIALALKYCDVISLVWWTLQSSWILMVVTYLLKKICGWKTNAFLVGPIKAGGGGVVDFRWWFLSFFLQVSITDNYSVSSDHRQPFNFLRSPQNSRKSLKYLNYTSEARLRNLSFSTRFRVLLPESDKASRETFQLSTIFCVAFNDEQITIAVAEKL